MPEEKSAELAVSTRSEEALDVAAAVTSLAPWLGGPVSQVLSGMSIGRKMGRVKEMLDGLASDLQSLRSEVSERYVRTDEFQELLERTLRAVADERSEEKRRIYRAFLAGTIRTPEEAYDEQVRFLRTLQEIQADHIRILKAIMQVPEQDLGIAGSQLQTLGKRLPDLPRERIQDLVGQLNSLRVTNLTSLTTMLTAHGAADLRHGLTAYGHRFIAYL
jgi:hypothetical protein